MKNLVTAVVDGPRDALAVAINAHAAAVAALEDARRSSDEAESESWSVLGAIVDAETWVDRYQRMGDADRAAIAAEELRIKQRDEVPARAAVVAEKDRIPSLEREVQSALWRLEKAVTAVAKAEVAPMVAAVLADMRDAQQKLLKAGSLLGPVVNSAK